MVQLLMDSLEDLGTVILKFNTLTLLTPRRDQLVLIRAQSLGEILYQIYSKTEKCHIHHFFLFRVAKLDKRIGTCTVLASNKWEPIYEECEKMLGFSGNAACDVLTAWSRIAAGTFEQHQHNLYPVCRSASDSPLLGVGAPLRRAVSLNTISKTVRAPGELISLERARALTFQDDADSDERTAKTSKRRPMDDLEASLMHMSIEHSIKLNSGTRIKISGPLHLQEEMMSSYPPAGNTGLNYSPQADDSPPMEQPLISLIEEDGREVERERENERKQDNTPFDTNQAIQRYIDQVSGREGKIKL